MLRGIKLDSNKEISITSEIVDASFPNKVYIPLINNGVICESLTKKGRKVNGRTYGMGLEKI